MLFSSINKETWENINVWIILKNYLKLVRRYIQPQFWEIIQYGPHEWQHFHAHPVKKLILVYHSDVWLGLKIACNSNVYTKYNQVFDFFYFKT